ncbi:DMT family transporter [Flavimaribacter sediminis]|nr:DMT family transporter [Flavimaribacter sediminis]
MDKKPVVFDDATHTNPLLGIALKIASILVFLGMVTCIKEVGDRAPAGQVVFFRSSVAMIPILVYLALRGQLHTAFYTKHLFSHFWRGLIGVSAMALSFIGIVLLPLPDAVALGYARPLIMVVLAAIFLGETIRVYRWSAVAVGLVGVVVISWSKLTLFDGDWEDGQALGVIVTLVSAVLAGFVSILVRRLIQTERTPTIVLYFSLSASLLSLATLPFGWVALDMTTLWLLIASGVFGGIGQILLTQSYRFAEVSTIAPFEYTSIIGAIIVGYFLFGDIPEISMLVGTSIVVAAGIFIILREHRLGIERRNERKFHTPNG